jgi:hypothetical protein
MLKTLDSASNFLRAVVSLAVTGILGVAGWIGYDTYYSNERALKEKDAQLAASQAQVDALTKDVEKKQREIERLDTALRLLKVDHRVAQLEVLDQKQDPDSGRLITRVSFVETDDEGRPLEKAREFEIAGSEVHIDALVVSFRDEYVEKGDPLRGTALCLFRRIYGDEQKPSEGAPLDPVGARPAAYSRGSEPSDLEKRIWGDFWEYANNPKKAEEDGVRTAQGKVSYTQLRPQMRYRLMLRSTGDFTIHPETSPARKAL